jgi:hypothetical protein
MRMGPRFSVVSFRLADLPRPHTVQACFSFDSRQLIPGFSLIFAEISITLRTTE